VQAKLINAGDEVLVRRGLLTLENVRTYTADALVDTGSVMSVLPIQVAQQLDYLVDCRNRRLIGNPAHPDQPVLKVK
ncbi:MAG: hypothetical protein ACREBD_10540, partial [Blastocatellia bacterium]